MKEGEKKEKRVDVGKQARTGRLRCFKTRVFAAILNNYLHKARTNLQSSIYDTYR
jgi:hypothetical protein